MRLIRHILLSCLGVVLALTANAEVLAQCKNLPELNKKLSPSVVFIKVDYKTVEKIKTEYLEEPQFHKVFYTGSGVMVSEDGKVLTIDHVIFDHTNEDIQISASEKRSTIFVLESITVFLNGQSYDGKVIAYDTWSNAGVISIKNKDGSKFPKASFGDVSKLRLGDCIFTISNPGNYRKVIKESVISGFTDKNSMINLIHANYILSNLALNKGDSGGPVFNQKGELVAINALRLETPFSASMLLDDFARNVIDSFVDGRVVEIPYVGTMDLMLDLKAIEQNLTNYHYNLFRNAYLIPADIKSGIVIINPLQDGLQHKDIVLAINRVPVTDLFQFLRLVAATKPGQTSQLAILRNGRRIYISTEFSVHRIVPYNN